MKDKIIYNGARDDQTIRQKHSNYKLDEVCSAPQEVIWTEKTNFTHYTIRNQDGSSQCVCMTLATEMGILCSQKYEEWIDFSSSFPYQQRGNLLMGGCGSSDVYSVFPKLGNVFESIMPSQDMNENACMTVPMKSYYKDLAKPFTVRRVELPIDFETVASTIQATGKGVMVWFHFNSAEWTDYPTVGANPATGGHSVTAVDFGLVGGKKYLVIQDSWGLDHAVKGLRFISEGYFKSRCYLASYLKTFKAVTLSENGTRPVFDGSVTSLQDILKFEGFFPLNVESTGYFGSISKKALIQFQVKYEIISSATASDAGMFGPKTKAKLYELYR